MEIRKESVERGKRGRKQGNAINSQCLLGRNSCRLVIFLQIDTSITVTVSDILQMLHCKNVKDLLMKMSFFFQSASKDTEVQLLTADKSQVLAVLCNLQSRQLIL